VLGRDCLELLRGPVTEVLTPCALLPPVSERASWCHRLCRCRAWFPQAWTSMPAWAKATCTCGYYTAKQQDPGTAVSSFSRAALRSLHRHRPGATRRRLMTVFHPDLPNLETEKIHSSLVSSLPASYVLPQSWPTPNKSQFFLRAHKSQFVQPNRQLKILIWADLSPTKSKIWAYAWEYINSFGLVGVLGHDIRKYSCPRLLSVIDSMNVSQFPLRKIWHNAPSTYGSQAGVPSKALEFS
jgi:hypothetical protein